MALKDEIDTVLRIKRAYGLELYTMILNRQEELGLTAVQRRDIARVFEEAENRLEHAKDVLLRLAEEKETQPDEP